MMRRSVVVLLAAQVLCAAEGDWIARAGGTAVRDASGRVVSVDLRNSWVTDGDLSQLAALPALTYLDLSQTRITDLGMQNLKNAPMIEELNLYYAEQVTDEGMAAVKGWTRLKRINLRGTKISDATLEHLSGLAMLESIDAGFAQVTDVGIDKLSVLPNLRSLTLSGNKLSDAGLHSLRQMPGLTYLDIGGQQRTDSGLWTIALSDPGVETLAMLRELKELRLDALGVSAASLANMKTLTKLERLSLQGCRRLGDDAVAALVALPALKILDVSMSAMTAKGIDEFKKARPTVQVLNATLPAMGSGRGGR